MEMARGVIETVAKAISDNYGIKIVFEGSECKTDGRTIYLPSLPDLLPGKLVETLRGYLDHEVGHILFSDFSVLKKVRDSATKFTHNVIEDIYVEMKMEEVWKGCALNFRRAEEEVDPDLYTEWEKFNPITKTLMLFMKVARRGWDCEFVSKKGLEYLPVLDFLSDEVEESKRIKDSAHSLDLARRVLEKIHEFSESPPERSPEPGDSSKTDESEDSDSGDSSKKDESGDSSEPEKSESDGKSSKKKSKKTSSKKKSKKSGKSESSESSPEGDVSAPGSSDGKSEKLKKELKKHLTTDHADVVPSVSSRIKRDASKLEGYRVFSTSMDTFEPARVAKDALAVYETIKKECSGYIGVLKNQMYRILMSQKRSRWQGGKREGFLNPSTLHHVVNNTSDAVFRVRHEGRKINTAVSILVDLSSSMCGSGPYCISKIEMAQKTAILLAEVLKLLNVPFEILGFTGDLVHSYSKHAEKFSRWGSLDMVLFKSFSESFGQTQKERLGSMPSLYLGQNYDGESVQFAANRLLRMPEKKKVLFVLSDGQPYAQYCDRDSLSDHLRDVVARLENVSDLYVCGFGILTGAPANYYKNHVLVKDLSDLPKSLLENLWKALR